MAPESPKTFGEHLLKRRLAFGLLQRELAARFGIHIETLKNWEHDRNLPDPARMPLVLRFIGHDPREQSLTATTEPD